MSDSKIDFSDALKRLFQWRSRSRFYRPVKQLISLRLDADELAWFGKRGPRYQTYINEVLRREADAHRGGE